MSDVRLFIGGKWREGSSGDSADITNPATAEPIGRVALAGEGDVQDAIGAAASALPAWRAMGAEQRAAILRNAAGVIAEKREQSAAALTLEQGKTLAESHAEFARVIETLMWHAQAASTTTEPRSTGRKSTWVVPEPIGIVAALTPWNYPAVIVARKLSAALAAGCPVILKAAEETPNAAAAIVMALEAAGLPPGVVNLVFGDPPAVAAELLESTAVKAISFTGSTAVGKQIAAAASRTLKRCVLELGGHAPVIVCADAELDAAVAAIAAYKFECAGQSCNAPGRVYVERSRYQEFVDRLAAAAGELRVGDGMDATTDMGPLANPRRLTAIQRLADDACAHGARMVTGGRRLEAPGYFWPPTIVIGAPDTAALMREEPFGPVLPIAPFSTLEEGVGRANANSFGLAAYVFTTSTSIARVVSTALEAGSVGINELRGVPPDVGIAGTKDSGYGYEGGRPGIEAFLNLKVTSGLGV